MGICNSITPLFFTSAVVMGQSLEVISLVHKKSFKVDFFLDQPKQVQMKRAHHAFFSFLEGTG